ncbi:hypothetical protein DWV02_23080 [Citrobacter freundii]|nr:hypothetical protein DWV02_23080 [Citrobacter freundii]
MHLLVEQQVLVNQSLYTVLFIMRFVGAQELCMQMAKQISRCLLPYGHCAGAWAVKMIIFILIFSLQGAILISTSWKKKNTGEWEKNFSTLKKVQDLTPLILFSRVLRIFRFS